MYRKLFTVGVAFLLIAGICKAQVSQPLETNVVKLSAVTAEATAVNAHTFRLHVSFTESAQKPSLFIYADPTQTRIKTDVVKDGSFSGVKTAAGALLVDRNIGQWMLKDSTGRVVIPATPLPSLGNDTRTNDQQVICQIAASEGQAALYGSGDMNGGILQTRGQGRVGNGTTGVPYYWTSKGYSIFVLGEDDNAPAGWQRVSQDGPVTWTVPGRTMDLYLSPVSKLVEATQNYAELTGRPPVPPRWSFGYMQSRWGWKDRAYIEDTLKQFLDRKLPVDAFIFDFEWYTALNDYALPVTGTADYSDFSWNPALFPEPEKQIADMHSKGVYVVGIRKPRVGNSESLNLLRNNGWLKAADSKIAAGSSPFGSKGTEQRLIDYDKPGVRDWYANQMAPLLKTGIDGWWNDEGEQSYTTYTYWNQSEVLAQSQAVPAKRMWTINRAFQPGMQRYGATTWTGDIASNWQALADTPTRLLNWSLAGMYYGTCDIGGFMGENTPELLTRWMEAAVFFPIMRSHSSNRVQPRFPWLYGEQAETAIRKALELRYRLVPYYYSLAYEASEKGTPLMRPLAMTYPDDPQVANLTNQWLMGDGLMAAPVMTQAATERSVYFPKGMWFAFDSNKTLTGGQGANVTAALDQIPVFVRAGTILPLAPVIQHTDDLPGGPLDLQIYPGANTSFTFTEDDGKTTAYMKGQFRRTTFTWDDAGRTLSWKVDGPYRGKDIFKELKVTVFDAGGILTRTGSLENAGKMILSK
jgi:alpha-glucosidase